ncbi:hypothetical protein OROGR_012024 [Orobanche gracilis]
MVGQCSEVSGFHMPMVICSDHEKISLNDLLLVSDKKFDGKLPDAYAFALVEQCQKDKIRLRLFLGGEVKRLNTNQIQIRQRLLNMVHVVSEVKKICFLEKYIESSHNDSQLEAIYTFIDRVPSGFVADRSFSQALCLDSGTPGTGKTQTILGLLSAILHATPPRVQSNEGKQVGVKRGPEFPIQENIKSLGKSISLA